MKMYGFQIFRTSKNHLTTGYSNLNALVLLYNNAVPLLNHMKKYEEFCGHLLLLL